MYFYIIIITIIIIINVYFKSLIFSFKYYLFSEGVSGNVEMSASCMASLTLQQF
jgi:hypothetical protein